jgi:hypothetical protein
MAESQPEIFVTGLVTLAGLKPLKPLYAEKSRL